MYPIVKRITWLLLVATGTVLLFGGCATKPQDSAVPWSRPASWEGQLPGVGGL